MPCKGNSKLPFPGIKPYPGFRDSIFNNEKRKELLLQQSRFEFEKKEALLEASHEKALALGQAAMEEQTYKNN